MKRFASPTCFRSSCSSDRPESTPYVFGSGRRSECLSPGHEEGALPSFPFSLIFFPPLSQPTLSSVHTTAKVPLTISGSWQQGNGHGTREGGDGKASFLPPPWGEPNPRTMNRTEGKERGFLNSPYIPFPTLLCGSFTSGALAAAWGRGGTSVRNL